MSATLNYRQVGDVMVVDVKGKLTLGEGSAILRDGIQELVFERGTKKIVLNLQEVVYIDPSGIGELVSGFTTLGNEEGCLKLLFLTKRIEDLLRITKLYSVFEVFNDEAKAVASFN